MIYNSSLSSTIQLEMIRIMSTIIKGYIRNEFYQKRNEVSLRHRVDCLKCKITDLEIETEFTDSYIVEESYKARKSNFETFKESVQRGKQLPPRGWIVPEIIPEGSICNLQAVEKSGKSILSTQIAHDCAYGLVSSLVPTSLIEVLKQEVFLYDAELDDDDMFERYKNFEDEKVHRCPNAEFESADALIHHIEDTVSAIESNVLVIVDNISAICHSFSHVDVKKIRNRVKILQDGFLAKGFRLTIILVHHTKTGSHGSDKHDSAGSRFWTRLAKLNLALSDTRYGDNTKMLSVASGRNLTKLIASDQALLLKLTSEPYPHFEFEQVCKIKEAMPNRKKSKTQNENSTTEEVEVKPYTKSSSWVLSDDEKEFVSVTYVKGHYGYGLLAKDILSKRGIDTTENNINQMKSSISRFFRKKDGGQL